LPQTAFWLPPHQIKSLARLFQRLYPPQPGPQRYFQSNRN